MLTEIGSLENVPAFIESVKAGNGRLMGFGHRVYKNYDPRATIIKQTAYDVFEVTGKNPLLDIALALEEAALSDAYFIDRKLYPNVDFYSGLIYQAMGFPVDMFTVLFAIPRITGWLAHWQELLDDPAQKISRPRQWYSGPDERDYVGIAAPLTCNAGVRHPALRDRDLQRRCLTPALRSEHGEGGVEGLARAHDGARQFGVHRVVATDVGRRTLRVEQLLDDLRLVVRERRRQRGELRGEFGVLGLPGELLRPVRARGRSGCPGCRSGPSRRAGDLSFSSTCPVARSSVSARICARGFSVTSERCSNDTASARNSPSESQRR